MKKTQRIISLLFVGLASAALFVACGDETSCLEDSDCAATEICVAEICETSCTTTAQCAEGETCTGGSGDRLYCVPGTTPTNNTNNTNNNNSNNTNNNTPPAIYHVLIRDTTTGAGCTATSGGEGDPGSDIAGARVETFEGTPLGYAEALEVNFGEEPNGNGFPNAYDILDGNPPNFAGVCPESFNEDSVFALGCGGWALVRFLDTNGTPVLLDDSMQIAVTEYGTNCGGSADDTLEIMLCTDAVTAAGGNASSCTIRLAQGSGLVIGEVSLP